MKIKMLTSMAGVGFALAIGEVTDRFSKKEAERFIDVGFAEAVPDVVDPVAALSEEKAKLEAELLKAKEDLAASTLIAEQAKALSEVNAKLEADLVKAHDDLEAAKTTVAEQVALLDAKTTPGSAASSETTEAPKARETRG